MYSVTPRFRPTICQTGNILGPSYYTVEVPPEFKESCVPFIFKSGHEFVKNVSYTDTTYEDVDLHRIIGGSSLKNRAKRVTFDTGAKGKTPAPNQYDPTHIKKEHVVPRRTRKLYMCKVPFYFGVKGPSVPSRMDDNGYTVDEHENLIKNPADVVDTSMGPAYYCINQCPNLSKRLYGGCKWSNRTAPRRTMILLNENPGPGNYNIAEVQEKPGEEVTARVRELAAAVAYLPRTIEAIDDKVRRDNYPGPADHNSPKPLVPRLANKYAAFNISSERFRDTLEALPGPGDYNIEGPQIVKKSIPSKSAYGPKSIAPKPKRKKLESTHERPGPASYNITRDPTGPKYFKYSQIPFDTSAMRLPRDGDTDLPGPANYGKLNISDDRKKPSSIFQSRCARLHDPTRIQTNAMYNISEDFNRLKNRKEFGKKEISFNSTSNRVAFKVEATPLPCCPVKVMVPRKGYFFPMCKRFEGYDNGVPGPGAYLHAPEQNSIVYKTTHSFNIRIKEVATGKKLRVHPRLTYDRWQKDTRKKKILHFFHRPKFQ